MMLRGEFTNTTKDVVRGMARAKLFPVKKMGELLSLGSPGTHEKEWASGSIVYHIGKGINVRLSEMAPRQIYVRISSRTFWSRKIDNCDLIVPYGVNFVSASLHWRKLRIPDLRFVSPCFERSAQQDHIRLALFSNKNRTLARSPEVYVFGRLFADGSP
jgi:hypothetical protein